MPRPAHIIIIIRREQTIPAHNFFRLTETARLRIFFFFFFVHSATGDEVKTIERNMTHWFWPFTSRAHNTHTAKPKCTEPTDITNGENKRFLLPTVPIIKSRLAERVLELCSAVQCNNNKQHRLAGN
jgi:hypothetical protein